MDRLLLAMLGGALGSGARYLVGVWAIAKLPEGFPFGTLIVNVLGSFAMGALAQWATTNDAITPNARAFLAAGILGGFTTYSSFNQETLDLLSRDTWGLAAFNAGATIASCLIAGVAGMSAARWCSTG